MVLQKSGLYLEVILFDLIKKGLQKFGLYLQGSLYSEVAFNTGLMQAIMGSNGLMGKVSASQPQDREFKPCTDHDHDSSYDTRTGRFQEADSRVINIIC